MKKEFISCIEQLGDYYSVARYEFNGDTHAFCIIENGDEWAVMARGGAILSRDIYDTTGPLYIIRMWQAVDTFMENLPGTPSEYRELIAFKTGLSGAVPEPETRYINSLPGRRITEARKALKLSQQTLSEKTGITQSKLSRIESGLADLECTELTVIAGQLQKPESYFFEEYRVENEEIIWVKDEKFDHYKPFCVIGMSPWSGTYRIIFAAQVTYERNLVIEEDSREQEISYPRHDYDRIIAVPWSNLVRTADGKGYILKDEPVKKDYAE